MGNSNFTTVNALTIDVEDYFQVENFAKRIKFSDWDKYECRVVKNTQKILEILRQADTKATFFVLGWVAEKFPELVKSIYSEGHEVANHGYYHQMVYSQTKEEFAKDIGMAKKILEDIIGVPIVGYRAPSFSITKRSLWAFDILDKEGFRYDSSFSPARYRGLPKDKKYPHKINGSLWEFPVSIGGGYFRLYPYFFTAGLIKQLNKKGKPAIIYLHPWEFDPAQPRLKGGALARFRHYVNLDKTEGKLRRLLREFEFAPVKELIAHRIQGHKTQ